MVSASISDFNFFLSQIFPVKYRKSQVFDAVFKNEHMQMMAYIKHWRKTTADLHTLVTDGNSDDEHSNLLLSCESDDGHHERNVDVDVTLQTDDDLDTLSDYGYKEAILSSESSDDSEQNDVPIPLSLNEDLASWATTNRIPRNTLGSLLGILRRHNCHNEIPKDPRTLLRTPRDVPSVSKCGGQYSYFGIESAITQVLENQKEFAVGHDSVELIVNIDGVPLFKSSNTQLWPILCKFSTFDPTLVALYCGERKPNSVEEYMSDFQDEYGRLHTNGLDFGGKKYKVSISCFICDAPARAFLKCVKLHCGYSSCERCVVHGSWNSGRVVFNNEDICASRTDEKFHRVDYNVEDDNHQQAPSPLLAIGFPCVTGFPLDYMHLVCLGVVKRVLTFLKQGPKGCRISRHQLNIISEKMNSLKSEIPSDFARKPRSLDLLDRWKATEFRQFLLYTGPIVLKDVLPTCFYKHFLTLSVAVSILLNSVDHVRNSHVHYAQELLCFFTNQAKNLYGETFCVYNVHNLIHLPDDVIKFQCSLNDICAFPFENQLQSVKKMVNSPQNPIAQCAKRIAERNACKAHVSKKVVKDFISTSRRDNCILLNTDEFAFVREKTDGGLICEVVHSQYVESFFTSPCDSKLLSIGYISANNARRRVRQKFVVYASVKSKVACLTRGEGYALFPLLHNAEAT